MVEESSEAVPIRTPTTRAPRPIRSSASFPRQQLNVNISQKLSSMQGTASKAEFLKKLRYFENGVQDTLQNPPKFGVRVIQPAANVILEERLAPDRVEEPKPRPSASAKYEINDDLLAPITDPFIEKEMRSKIGFFEHGTYGTFREVTRRPTAFKSVQISLDSSQFTLSQAVVVRKKFAVVLKRRLCKNGFGSLKYLSSFGKVDYKFEDVYVLDFYRLDLFDNDFYESELSDEE